MARPFLQKRRLRAPFVATVASAATAFMPACSGKTSDEPPAPAVTSDGGPEGGPDGGADGGPDSASACPATTPAQGGPCTGSAVCGVPCDLVHPAVACVNGTWVLSGGCNPPPPICACPAQLPVSDSSCADCAGRYPTLPGPGPSQTINCGYNECLGYPTDYATCDPTTGLWSVGHASCNPPPPTYDAGPDADAGTGPDGEGPDGEGPDSEGPDAEGPDAASE
jgi:hypothetical protein